MRCKLGMSFIDPRMQLPIFQQLKDNINWILTLEDSLALYRMIGIKGP